MNELNQLLEELKYALTVSPADDEETKAKKEKYAKEIEKHAKEIEWDMKYAPIYNPNPFGDDEMERWDTSAEKWKIEDELRQHEKELKKQARDKEVERLQQLAGIRQATQKQWTEYYKDIEKQVNKMANKQMKRNLK